MEAFLIFFLTGLFSLVAGILVLKRDTRLFANCVYTSARVVEFYEYRQQQKHSMYTMAVEYVLTNGEKIRASEQKGSSRKKYDVGDSIEIKYCVEKPDFFIVKGDYSRTIALIGMIVVGAGLIIASFFLL